MTVSRKQLLYGVLIMGIGGAAYYFGTNFFMKKIEKSVIIDICFDESMQTKRYATMLADGNASALLHLFKQLYEKVSPGLLAPSESVKIPRYIHMIWLGSPLPTAYEKFYQSWHDYHKTWTFIFWTDHPANYCRGSIIANDFNQLKNILKTNGAQEGLSIVVDASQVVYENKKFFDASNNYGERSDILRYQILYEVGGLYVDSDFQAVRALDELHYLYDFYTGLQPLDTRYVQLGAALLAAVPNHPILKACIEGIKYNQHIVPIVAKTGPLHFTRAFLAHAQEGPYINCAFPASFFYPCGYDERDASAQQWCKKEAFAVHHWQASWTKPEGFVKRT